MTWPWAGHLTFPPLPKENWAVEGQARCRGRCDAQAGGRGASSCPDGSLESPWVCPPPSSRRPLWHLPPSEQPCLLGRGGVGWGKGETGKQSLKAKVSLYIEKPPATQPDILGSAGPVGPPCGHRIPASKSLPASGWVNLVFEEGAWERDAGLVGLSWVSAVPPRPCWGDWNGSPGRGAAPRSAAGWAGTPGLPGLAQAPSANSLFLSSC